VKTKHQNGVRSGQGGSRTTNGSHTVAAATSAAILGLASTEAKNTNQPANKIPRAWRKFYQDLLQLRETLQQQRQGLVQDSSEQMDGYSLHMADSGSANFDRDFALSLLSSDQNALYEIEEALQRIRNGTYGVCEMSGRPIPEERLEAIPWTRYTVEAQAQFETAGTWRRRLGDLRTVNASDWEEPAEPEGWKAPKELPKPLSQ
jgi:RNA polymerase-binding transcription factor DksA